MPGWDSFALVVGGAGGALVGLLFVFATLLVASVILAVPSQPDRVVGGEFIALALAVVVVMIALERRASHHAEDAWLSRALQRINPNYPKRLAFC